LFIQNITPQQLNHTASGHIRTSQRFAAASAQIFQWRVVLLQRSMLTFPRIIINLVKVMENLAFNWSEAFGEYPGDTLDRARHACFLTQYLSQKGKDQSYVLNLNAAWGTGKTWFLQRWMNEIRHTFPTVYINAWKTDHAKDPFLAVVSEIKNQLISGTDKHFIQSAGFKHSWMLMKSVAPTLFKSIIKNKAGVDIEALSEGVIDPDAAGDITEKLVETLISSHQAAERSVEEFKTAISQWLEAAVVQNARRYPLFIFIDELDRCRPTYAIEMLETIKHIFDMKGVVFVVATDREQLQHAVRAIYGAEFDSQRYLERFFQRSVTLHRPTTIDFIRNIVSQTFDYEKLYQHADALGLKYKSTDELIYYTHIFSYIADELEATPRAIKKWLDRIDAVLLSKATVDIIFIAYLLALYSFAPATYKQLRKGYDLYDAKNKPNLIGKLTNYNLNIVWKYRFDYTGDNLNHYADRLNRTRQYNISLHLYCDYYLKQLKRYDTAEEYYTEFMRVVMQKLTSDDPDSGFAGLSGTSRYQTPLALDLLVHKKINRDRMSLHKYFDLCELATTLD
jgi:hypothetical protein